jgi:hypothetical protein
MHASHRTAIVLAMGALVLAVGPGLQAVDYPNLTGTWKLNKDQSDDPAKMAQEARESSSGGSGQGGGGGMGHGHGHGGGHGGGSRPSDGGAGPDPGFFSALDTLTIRHDEPTLTITDAAGRVRIRYTDGRKTEEEHSHGGTTKVVALWKDGHIEITSAPEHGPKVTETWSITADRSQLMVTTKFEGDHGSGTTMHRVYDAQGAAPKAPAGPEPTESPKGA